ncbi:phosphate-binding protein PstS [Marmoricola endophyticus]|uniref:Phosphate-binding protein n=1 Tax=Marmoricola endophyticus TaxID=2040280 RepID=A0A917BJM9_9ACTN|nr:phosphate ABC transporter substrate-binding protein PstS [Marmoricola endophyticus]GGF43931.1 phosphate-binding protein PstS [Marmoricola endophyticus]
MIRSPKRLALPGIAALALGLVLTGCGAGNESGGSGSGSSDLSGTLQGSGSSAQEAAMDTWRSSFQGDNSDVTVNYDPAGSGAGVEKFNGGGTDFAGSDSALSEEKGEIAGAKKRCGADAIEVPDYISPIALVYNLDGVDDLQLSAKTAANIFAGKITTWNDPAIKADNPDADLPSTRIDPVHRSDESGTTQNFTDYLSKASEGAWTSEPDKVWPIKSGEGATGTSGVVAAVKNASGSIGYADFSQAGDLSTAKIKVGDDYVEPSAEGAAKALEASPLADGRPENDLAVEVDRTTTESGAYPLFLSSYLIACPTYDDQAKADLVKGFLGYIVSEEGQKAAAENAGSAPLPSSLQEKAAAAIDTISAKG